MAVRRLLACAGWSSLAFCSAYGGDDGMFHSGMGNAVCQRDEDCDAGAVSLLQNALDIGGVTMEEPDLSISTLLALTGYPCYPAALPVSNDTGHLQAEPFEVPAFNAPATRGGLKHIYYINVDGAKERRDGMEQELEKQTLPYSRFAAINTTTVLDYDDAKKPFCEQDVSLGTRGCTQSHIELYKKILEEDPTGTDAYLILEDDALLLPGWRERVDAMLVDLPADASAAVVGMWGMARCEHLVAPEHGLYMTSAPDWIDWAYFYTGSTATVVWPYTLPTLLEKIERQSVSCHSDANLIISGKMRSYAMYPAPIMDRSEGSGRVDVSTTEQVADIVKALKSFEAQTGPADKTVGLPLSDSTGQSA